jgi:hypothetical protein
MAGVGIPSSTVVAGNNTASNLTGQSTNIVPGSSTPVIQAQSAVGNPGNGGPTLPNDSTYSPITNTAQTVSQATPITSDTGTSGTTSDTNTNGGQSDFTGIFNNSLGQIQNAYNSLFGSNGGTGTYQSAVGSAAANLQNGYADQQGNLNAAYEQSQNQLPWELVGRGANSSSWADNNVNNAQQQFNNSTGQLNSAEAGSLAGLSSQEAQNQALYQQDIANWNNPQFQAMLNTMPAYEQSEQYSNLQQAQANLAGTAGANQSIPAELANIQNTPVYQQQGGAALGQQLQALANSGAPTSTQQQIGSALTANQTNPDNSVWTNYFQTLQNNPQTPLPAGY